MNSGGIHYEKIEAYLNDELSGEALSQIEKEIHTNPEFAQAVDEAREVKVFMEYADQAYFKEKINAIERDFFSDNGKEVELAIDFLDQTSFREKMKSWEDSFERGKKPAGRQIWMLLAQSRAFQAAASFLIICTFGFLFVNNRYSNESLVNRKFSVRAFGTQKGGTGSVDSLLSQGMISFHEKKYEAAIQTFQSVLAIDATQNSTKFYLADAYMATKQAAKSIPLYQALLNDPIFGESAQWNLALAYVASGKVEEGKKQLTLIQESSNENYQSQATDLLEDLNSIWYRIAE